MRNRQPRLPTDIRTELNGLEWNWIKGAKHWKLMVEGHLVAIWPHGSTARQTTDGRPTVNIRAQIRRFRRQQAA